MRSNNVPLPGSRYREFTAAAFSPLQKSGRAVEFTLQVPGKYMLVDHALSRVERGLAGVLEVTGPDDPNVYKDHDPERSAQSMSH